VAMRVCLLNPRSAHSRITLHSRLTNSSAWVLRQHLHYTTARCVHEYVIRKRVPYT